MADTDAHRAALPRDLSEEITSELIQARIRVARNATRVAALESLLEIVWGLERELRRPVTLLDVVSSTSAPEQARRTHLIRALRDRMSGALDPANGDRAPCQKTITKRT